MPTKEDFVCLANSRRPGGRCVAGKEIKGKTIGGWIRPVHAHDPNSIFDNTPGALLEYATRCQDGRVPELLDIVQVSFQGRASYRHQTENRSLVPNKQWERVGQFPFSRVRELVDPVDRLWINGFEGANGTNDRIPESRMGVVDTSLLLIQPSSLVIHRGFEFGSNTMKTRADFFYRKVNYCFSITDPAFEERIRLEGDGDYRIESKDVYLTISLSEAYKGFCYKLVAGVILPPEE